MTLSTMARQMRRKDVAVSAWLPSGQNTTADTVLPASSRKLSCRRHYILLLTYLLTYWFISKPRLVARGRQL